MARSLWTGHITFGLVNIPIQLFTVIREQRVRFHLLTEDGSCRLRQKLFCPESGKEYDFSQTAKGYELAPGQYVILDKEELEKVEPEKGRSIDIVDFVDLKSIDPIYFDRPYYAVPDKKSSKSYGLLVESMKDSARVGIAKFVMRDHEYLAAVRVINDILCVQTMHFAEDIVSADDIDYDAPKAEKIGPREMKLASQLIDTLYTKFKPDKYPNEYHDRLMDLIEKKAAGKKIAVTEERPKQTTKVVDLLSVLQKSLKGGARSDSKPAKNRTRASAKSGKSGSSEKKSRTSGSARKSTARKRA